MRFLLDTHALIWLLVDDPKLGKAAREAILDPANDVLVSIVSLWEMAVKSRIGKLGGVDIEKIQGALTEHGLSLLSLEPRHIEELLKLPIHPDHRDPFDHQLIAQAIAEELTFLTNDPDAARYDVRLRGCSGEL